MPMTLSKAAVIMAPFVLRIVSGQTQLIDIGTDGCVPPEWAIGTGTHAECQIKFHVMFGGRPRVTLGQSGYSEGALPAVNMKVKTNSVTSSGFILEMERNDTQGGASSIRWIRDVSWIAVGEPPALHGTVSPRYKVLGVIYAPPGTKGSRSSSTVTYGKGSTFGTTTSSSRTFKQNYAVTVEAKAGLVGGSAGFTYGRSVANTETADIKKSTNDDISSPGPSEDGINHDYDQIHLSLCPKLDLALTSSSASWTFADDEHAKPQYVYVGALKGTMTLPEGTAVLFRNCGITKEDYLDILRHDPLASGSIEEYPDRYRFVKTFAYEPPPTDKPNDQVPIQTYTISYSSGSSSASNVTNTSIVDLSFSREASEPFLGLAKASMKSAGKWEWTDSLSVTSSVGSSETATCKIGGPAYGYKGSTLMRVYFDMLYKTFAFATVTTSIGLRGALVSSKGTPIPWTEVSASSNGVTQRTVTNGKGEFQLFGDMSGEVTIIANGVTQTLPALSRSIRTTVLREK